MGKSKICNEERVSYRETGRQGKGKRQVQERSKRGRQIEKGERQTHRQKKGWEREKGITQQRPYICGNMSL